MKLFLKVPPSHEPLSREEVKACLRLSEDQDNDFLPTLISSARAYVEGVTGRALLKQKWILEISPPYPSSSPLVKVEEKSLEINLPHPPLLEVEVVTMRGKEIPFMVKDSKVLLSSSYWNKEISIAFWAGYGETAASLPPDLKIAVLIATRCFYDQQKGDFSLLTPFKVHHLI